jgi:hypothetical protein
LGSWIEELVARYYWRKGFFVEIDHPFYLPREETGKKVGGWSDIDVLAFNGEELHIVQCKVFLGERKAEESALKILKWFEKAEDYIKNRSTFANSVKQSRIIRAVVLEDPHPRKAIRMLENEGIKVPTLEEIVDELIQSIEEEMKEYKKERTGRVGKLEDPVMALLRELVRKKKLGSFFYPNIG